MASGSGGSGEGPDSAAVKVFSCLFPRGLTGVDPWLNCGGLMTQESVCMCVCVCVATAVLLVLDFIGLFKGFVYFPANSFFLSASSGKKDIFKSILSPQTH